MSSNNRYDNTTQAFTHKLYDVMYAGSTITVRDMTTKEIESELISIKHPEQRCYFVSHRNDNIFAKIAETLWMLAGRDDIEWLSYYLPRAKDFSDNGKTWRGAYGPRIRNWNGANGKVDQLSYLHTILNLDPYTRQAVISIWDPSEDTMKVTKDRPCNNWIQFYARDTYNTGNMHLNMNITQRSCDLLWGYSGIDTFSWSVLQQMMAYWTNMQIGHSNHFITSLHIYEQHWKRAEKIMEMYVDYNPYAHGINIVPFSTNLHDIDEKLQYLFSLEGSARENYDEYTLNMAQYLEDEFLTLCSQMLFAYVFYKQLKTENDMSCMDMAYVLNSMSFDSDFRLAAIEYFTREDPEILQHLVLSDLENETLHTVYNRI